MTNELRFIVDHNVGKLAKWLRMMGYDTVFFDGEDDWDMVRTALREGRVVLTRDSQFMERGVITQGRVKAILVKGDEPEAQLQQVVTALNLDTYFKPFTICLECNQPLVEIEKQNVKARVPPYVYQTQSQYLECPSCHRIYWRGTHWQSMAKKLERLRKDSPDNKRGPVKGEEK
ncbi:MAG: Mut7-C RNAse domain-containing protein [Chloroflexi bacterium]|nr:Mut7-C RNAse domain-containing protein [Chloroflexota bacterium]